MVWGPEEFLSDTLGETVYASGMVNPEYFNVHVVQEFDAFGGLLCEADADILVGTCEITIPNVISPYGTSGANDMFRIPGIETYENVELVILNRWGNVVYESDDFGASSFWDAEADGATSGVYYYKLTIPVEDGPLVVTSIAGNGVEYYPEEGKPVVLEGTVQIVD